jgi:hypothetical protein
MGLGPHLIQQLPGFLAGFLSAVIIPLLSTKVRDKLQKWLTEKEFAGLSEKAQKIYFTREIPLREKPERLSELWIEIVVKYEHGELRAKDVGRLDRYIRECRKRLLEDLKSEAGPTT